MAGDLTVREQTAPVLFDVTAVISGDTLTGTAEARVRFTDLGLTPPEILGTLRVANEFRIRANIKALSGE
jgi:polyisoprenoid-binding protein YceI